MNAKAQSFFINISKKETGSSGDMQWNIRF